MPSPRKSNAPAARAQAIALICWGPIALGTLALAFLLSPTEALWRGLSAPAARSSALARPAFIRLDRPLFLSKAQALGPGAHARALAYIHLVDELSRLPPDARLWAARASASLDSTFQYAEDMEVWGAPDYWASPLEFASKGRGDCEDFAIAAYYAFASAGWPRSGMRLAYGSIELGGRAQPHVVLLLDSPEGYLALDSAHDGVDSIDQRLDLSISYSFDDERVYQGVHGPSVGSSAIRIAQWRSVLSKARTEGFH